MNRYELKQYEMFVRVRDFGAAHAASFAAGSLGTELFSGIGKVVQELASHVTNQVVGSNTMLQDTKTRAACRAELRGMMESISRTARAIALTVTGLEDKFRMPRNTSDRFLISAARGFIQDATPLKEEFIRHELPPNFLEELEAGIQDFERAIEESNATQDSRITATAAIDEAIERGVMAVRRLDPLVRNKFRDTPSILAAWTSARHVEKPGRPQTAAAPVAPAK